MTASNSNLYMEIGNRIQALRRLHHMTQEQLAERLDVSVKHISSVERGISLLSLEKLIQVCGILDCGLDYLVLNREPSAIDSGYIPKGISDYFLSADEKDRELLSEYLLMFLKLRKDV